MKFNVMTKDLKSAMTTLKKAMYFQSALPIATCIRFNTAEKSVGLVGTDLETLIAEEIQADVEIQGEGCINFKQLEACIKGKKKRDHVTYFEEDNGMMRLTVSGVISRLSIESTTDYPVIPVIETSLSLDLATGIEKCLPFASYEDTRLQINGVHVHSKEHELVFVATDGRTLKVVRTDPLPESVAPELKDFAITIPSKSCSAIVSHFKDVVDVGINTEQIDGKDVDRQLRVSCSNRELITRLIEGEFVDYESVLAPAKNLTGKAEIELNREEFLEIITTVCALGLAVKEKKNEYASRTYCVWIEMVDGVMDIRYNHREAKVTQMATHAPLSYSYDGYLLMALNPRLLIRALESFDTPVISMYVKPLEPNDKNEMGNVLDSVYFRDADRSEDTVIMPMKSDGPKFGPDWVAMAKEEERKATIKKETESFKRSQEEMARQAENLKEADEWTANQQKGSDDHGNTN